MGTRQRHAFSWLAAAVAVALAAPVGGAGCGSKRERVDRDGAEDAAAAVVPAPAPLPPAEPLPLGMPSLDAYAYNRGPGRSAFVRAIEAERALQWAEAAALSQGALDADPQHLEAWWVVATSLARQGAHDRVLAPLSAAVAGDWLRWGERSLEDEALAGFLPTAHGARYRALAEVYRERYHQAVTGGVLVVGRRGKPWYPRRTGEVVINHRSEIYAYNLAQRRYVRVSRTDGALVGFVRAPVGAALVYASYRRIAVPGAGGPRRSGAPAGASAGAQAEVSAGTPAEVSAGPRVRMPEVRVGMIDLERGRMGVHEVVFEDVAELSLGYEAVPAAAGSTGDPVTGPVPVVRVQSERDGMPRAYLLDFDTGHGREIQAGADGAVPGADSGGATAGTNRGQGAAAGDLAAGSSPGALPAPGSAITETLVVAHGQVRKQRIPVDGVAADWDDAGTAGAFRLERTRRTVTLPAGASANGHSMVWSPTQARLAFATAALDRCARDAASRHVVLFAVEAATGTLRQVAEGTGDFAPLWLDDTRLAYMEEATGAVVIADVVTGAVVDRLEGSGGVGTDRLPGPRACPPAAETGAAPGDGGTAQPADAEDPAPDLDTEGEDPPVPAAAGSPEAGPAPLP